jgi:uncharacterized protein
MKTRIVLFAKMPVPGAVKTRLIPVLGPEGAARLARRLLATTLREAVASGLAVELCGDPDARLWGPTSLGLALSSQGEGDLGARLHRAAERTIAGGEKVLLVGADCPDLDAERLQEAAHALDRYDAVIHPAEDGGYALLGLNRNDPSLFDRIPWSSPDAGPETCARIAALGWSLNVRETLRDIDQPADLALLPQPLLPIAAH